MFYSQAEGYIYSGEIPEPMGDNAYFPIELDTEYTHLRYDFNHPSSDICTNLTVQCAGIHQKPGIIYAHPDNAPDARHRVFTEGFVAIDYLKDQGHDVALQRLPSWDVSTDIPWLQFDIYTFFAVAELFRVFQGVYREDIKFLCTNNAKYGVEQTRRLRAYTVCGNKTHNYVEMPWLVVLNGQPYRVRLAIFDTSAVHGTENYSGFCSNSNIKLPYKDNFTNKDKGRMDVMYKERPEDFDNYALGDLYNHDALMGNSDNFFQIYERLGLTEHFTHPRLTIGSTVSKIIEASIKNLFPNDNKIDNLINKFCKFASADWLKRKSTTTACLNAKVDGGRCRNNRPTDTYIEGVICDIDISSCYGEGLRIQTYPLGSPMLIDYPIKAENNDYLTLRKFLKTYGHELVPGLWQARVSTKEGYQLKYPQDYLPSWFPPKDLSKMPTDTAFADTEQWWTVDNVGEIKILTNEVHHAIITHDYIQWLDNVASVKQRKELLDELIVETALFYPASLRVNNVEDLLQKHQEHKGKNKTFAITDNVKSKRVSIEQDCYYWYGVNLGDLLVDKLILERKKHPAKTPFNKLYKLCVNTVYGDMVSPFFTVGNVVVGNNITARARALAWCMEKGLHGWETITDGCAFDLNRVLYPREGGRVNGSMVVGLYADVIYKHHTLLPLVDKSDLCVTLNSGEINLRVVEGKVELSIPKYDGFIELTSSDSIKWVNRVAMQHLQQLFDGLDILHQATIDVYGNQRIGQFEFEAKGLFNRATFHGSANYSLSLDDVTTYAMRSYSKKEHKLVQLADDLQVVSDDIKPSEVFLKSLTHPDAIGRSNVFIRERILKVGDYRRNYRNWKDTNVYPGCTVEVPSIVHEFSLSQFTFKTYAQLKSWRREYERLIRNYGQSYEMFFINDDGTLNFKRMVVTVDAAIRAGKMSLFEGMDKRSAHHYRNYMTHAQLECLERTRRQLSTRYHGCLDAIACDEISDDSYEIED